jgi:hypothetical protein
VEGLTGCVPPFDSSVYVLPSVPVTTTWVALTAVTVKVDELPEVMDVGLAVMPTVGAGFEVTVTVVTAVILPLAAIATAV